MTTDTVDRPHRRDIVKAELNAFVDSLSTKYHLNAEEIGCTMLMIEAIGKNNLDPENAARHIHKRLENGDLTFTYAGHTFTVSSDMFSRFEPNPQVFLASYKLFHGIHQVPSPELRVGPIPEEMKRDNVLAITESIMRYYRG